MASSMTAEIIFAVFAGQSCPPGCYSCRLNRQTRWQERQMSRLNYWRERCLSCEKRADILKRLEKR